MKLLFITSIKEDQPIVAKILNDANILVFSATETTGFKARQQINMMDAWFSSGDEKFDSVFLFSFCEVEKAENVVGLIKQYNIESATNFPIRAFIVPVELSSY